MRAQSRAERRRRKWEVWVLSARGHTQDPATPILSARHPLHGPFFDPHPRYYRGDQFRPPILSGGGNSPPPPQYYRGDKFRPPILSVILSEDPRKNPTLRG